MLCWCQILSISVSIYIYIYLDLRTTKNFWSFWLFTTFPQDRWEICGSTRKTETSKFHGNLQESEGIQSLPAHAAFLGWKSFWGSGYDLEAGIPPRCSALPRIYLLYGAVHAQHRSKPWLPDFWLSEVVFGRVRKGSCCEQWLPVWLSVGRKAQRSVDKPRSWAWQLYLL